MFIRRKSYLILLVGILFFTLCVSIEREMSSARLSFAVLSDLHIQSNAPSSQRKLTAALRDLNHINQNTNALILNGDLTNGMPADYTTLNRILGDNPHPAHVFYTIGNHEYYKAWRDSNGNWNPKNFPNGETEIESIQRFLTLTGEKYVYYDKKVKGYHFIFLGSERYRQSNPTNYESAYLSDEQLQWLEKTLQTDDVENKLIFIFLHQPLPNTVAGTSNCCISHNAVIQHEKLLEILTRYPEVILFTGHSHWSLRLPHTLIRKNFTMINSSSVQQIWTDDIRFGEISADPLESEGLYIEVYDDRIRIRGRDFYRKRWIKQSEFVLQMNELR